MPPKDSTKQNRASDLGINCRITEIEVGENSSNLNFMTGARHPEIKITIGETLGVSPFFWRSLRGAKCRIT